MLKMSRKQFPIIMVGNCFFVLLLFLLSLITIRTRNPKNSTCQVEFFITPDVPKGGASVYGVDGACTEGRGIGLWWRSET